MMKNICLIGLNNVTPSGFSTVLAFICYNINIPSGLEYETKARRADIIIDYDIRKI